MKTKLILVFMLSMTIKILVAQVPKVDIEGDDSEFIRVVSTKFFGAEAGLELTLDNGAISAADWRIVNYNGKLVFFNSVDNFNTAGTNKMTVDRHGHVGLGTDDPQTTMHIAEGSEASNATDGYLLIGQKMGLNLVFDENEINSRNNGSSSSLYLQREGGHIYVGSGGGNTFLSHGGGHTYTGYNGGATYLSHGGGNTYTGYNGGNTFLSYGGGYVGIGTTVGNAKLNLSSDEFQIYTRNPTGGTNDWYIGASNSTWSVGDDQLIFSPTSASSASKFRLRDVADSDGLTAPVEIVTATHKLLLDGNEIDANTPLYINHNTNENTYINPTGGRAAVGSTSPWGMLHVRNTDINDHCLTLEGNFGEWAINPSNTHTNENLFFVPAGNGGNAVSGIDRNSGNYLTFSDRRLKENIRTLSPMLEKVNQLELYTYQLKHDKLKKSNIGVMAQDIQQLFPELMGTGEEYLAVAYGPMSVIALKAVQELSMENKQLNAKIEAQQRQIESILQQLSISNK